MTDVSRVLSAIGQGDARAAGDLLPLVYDELRRLAAAQVAREQPGQTLDATALVHEAYLRLVANPAGEGDVAFANRRHFFAAAEAMRRILVDRARARRAAKRGGERQRVQVELDQLPARLTDDELLDLDAVLGRLSAEDEVAARVVHLHVFADFSVEEAGTILGLSRAAAYRNWAFARAWLREALSKGSGFFPPA
jgi:RNA polymerase sigma factor (TIGR02999 family)